MRFTLFLFALFAPLLFPFKDFSARNGNHSFGQRIKLLKWRRLPFFWWLHALTLRLAHSGRNLLFPDRHRKPFADSIISMAIWERVVAFLDSSSGFQVLIAAAVFKRASREMKMFFTLAAMLLTRQYHRAVASEIDCYKVVGRFGMQYYCSAVSCCWHYPVFTYAH